MSKICSSPERHTFQASASRKKLEKDPTDKSSLDVIQWYEQVKVEEANKLLDPEWQKNNLEYDLRSTDWICEKAKSSSSYAQNLYAALCNNDLQKLEVMIILSNQTWSCSWRHAGGIIADMTETGDYIDWYCSGIRDDHSNGYIGEGVVTDEIRNDLKILGWVVI